MTAEAAVVRIVVRRLVLAVPLLFLVSVISFVLIALTPGNAAQAILGVNASPAAVDKLERQLGLSEPVYEQYWHWLGRALHGDLGVSLFSGETVLHAISVRLPVTLSLMIGALLVSLVFGVGIGIVSAVRGGLMGRAMDGLILVGFALPAFWLGAELIELLAVKAGWFRATGFVPLEQSPGGWLRSLVLPVTALGVGGVAAVARQTREAMLDVLGTEFITMARANGIPAWSLILRHALKNSAIRVSTVIGLQAVALLGGTVVVENVFALPGLGSLAANAATRHDIPQIQGIVLYYTVMVIIVNLLVDLTYLLLNPRVTA